MSNTDGGGEAQTIVENGSKDADLGQRRQRVPWAPRASRADSSETANCANASISVSDSKDWRSSVTSSEHHVMVAAVRVAHIFRYVRGRIVGGRPINVPLTAKSGLALNGSLHRCHAGLSPTKAPYGSRRDPQGSRTSPKAAFRAPLRTSRRAPSIVGRWLPHRRIETIR
jgi:hypothetical protein